MQTARGVGRTEVGHGTPARLSPFPRRRNRVLWGIIPSRNFSDKAARKRVYLADRSGSDLASRAFRRRFPANTRKRRAPFYDLLARCGAVRRNGELGLHTRLVSEELRVSDIEGLLQGGDQVFGAFNEDCGIARIARNKYTRAFLPPKYSIKMVSNSK